MGSPEQIVNNMEQSKDDVNSLLPDLNSLNNTNDRKDVEKTIDNKISDDETLKGFFLNQALRSLKSFLSSDYDENNKELHQLLTMYKAIKNGTDTVIDEKGKWTFNKSDAKILFNNLKSNENTGELAEKSNDDKPSIVAENNENEVEEKNGNFEKTDKVKNQVTTNGSATDVKVAGEEDDKNIKKQVPTEEIKLEEKAIQQETINQEEELVESDEEVKKQTEAVKQELQISQRVVAGEDLLKGEKAQNIIAGGLSYKQDIQKLTDGDKTNRITNKENVAFTGACTQIVSLLGTVDGLSAKLSLISSIKDNGDIFAGKNDRQIPTGCTIEDNKIKFSYEGAEKFEGAEVDFAKKIIKNMKDEVIGKLNDVNNQKLYEIDMTTSLDLSENETYTTKNTELSKTSSDILSKNGELSKTLSEISKKEGNLTSLIAEKNKIINENTTLSTEKTEDMTILNANMGKLLNIYYEMYGDSIKDKELPGLEEKTDLISTYISTKKNESIGLVGELKQDGDNNDLYDTFIKVDKELWGDGALYETLGKKQDEIDGIEDQALTDQVSKNTTEAEDKAEEFSDQKDVITTSKDTAKTDLNVMRQGNEAISGIYTRIQNGEFMNKTNELKVEQKKITNKEKEIATLTQTEMNLVVGKLNAWQTVSFTEKNQADAKISNLNSKIGRLDKQDILLDSTISSLSDTLSKIDTSIGILQKSAENDEDGTLLKDLYDRKSLLTEKINEVRVKKDELRQEIASTEVDVIKEQKKIRFAELNIKYIETYKNITLGGLQKESLSQEVETHEGRLSEINIENMEKSLVELKAKAAKLTGPDNINDRIIVNKKIGLIEGSLGSLKAEKTELEKKIATGKESINILDNQLLGYNTEINSLISNFDDYKGIEGVTNMLFQSTISESNIIDESITLQDIQKNTA